MSTIYNQETEVEVIGVSKSAVRDYRVSLEGGGLSFNFYMESPPQLGDKFNLSIKVESK
jgi:hypothetical protein